MADTATSIVTLTPKAQEMVKGFLAEESDPTGKVLRVGVTSGGCSGFSYEIAIDLRQDDDVVQSFDGFDLVVNPVSVQFLQNVTIDYVDTIGQAGFTFTNPQAKSSCGCGNSFNV
jgi:iron-sulfur cluster assembly accessory protein